uniref:Uncharacterized protein n=1 Tax=Populus trichocarpa TaxID=3694 RepID=A0A2K1Y491_POPTR
MASRADTLYIEHVFKASEFSPTLAASADDLHSEVTAPLWLNDSRDQVEQTRVLIVVYCYAAALGSRLPS